MKSVTGILQKEHHFKEYEEALIVTNEPAYEANNPERIAFLGRVYDFEDKLLKMDRPDIFVVIPDKKDNNYIVAKRWQSSGRRDLEIELNKIEKVLISLKKTF